MKNKLLSLLLILGISSSLFGQAVFTSSCGYTVTVYIKPVEIIVTSPSCEWGYNYNVRYHYDIVTYGSPNCGTGTTLTDFQIEIDCNNGQINGGYGLPLTISNSSGYLITSTNPYIPNNGTGYGYTLPYVNCNSATVENFQCKTITATIGGPGTFNSNTLPLNPGALPIELISFDATANENQVDLSWVTGSEKDNDYFTIERTVDGFTYEEVSRIKGQGNSSTKSYYDFSDKEPVIGVSYYRLKQTDFNGEFKTYDPISVYCKSQGTSVHVLPNPNDGSFYLRISSGKTEQGAEVVITDNLGKVIIKRRLDIKEGTTFISFNLNLEDGNYNISVLRRSGESVYTRLVINKSK